MKTYTYENQIKFIPKFIPYKETTRGKYIDQRYIIMKVKENRKFFQLIFEIHEIFFLNGTRQTGTKIVHTWYFTNLKSLFVSYCAFISSGEASGDCAIYLFLEMFHELIYGNFDISVEDTKKFAEMFPDHFKYLKLMRKKGV